jgi:hypothetical protein
MIVQTDADDPARIWHHRNQCQFFVNEIAGLIRDNRFRNRQRVAGDKVDDGRLFPAHPGRQIDNAALLYCTIMDGAAMLIAYELHFSLPFQKRNRFALLWVRLAPASTSQPQIGGELRGSLPHWLNSRPF